MDKAYNRWKARLWGKSLPWLIEIQKGNEGIWRKLYQQVQKDRLPVKAIYRKDQNHADRRSEWPTSFLSCWADHLVDTQYGQRCHQNEKGKY